MLKYLILPLLVFFVLVSSPQAFADNPPTEIKVSLGSVTGELKFFPDNLELISGQKYKIILDNPSNTKHYFTAREFASTAWTQKVEAGKVEVKGSIYEIELKPTAQAEWVLTPMKLGTYELHCSIPGHTEAGMTGKIFVKGA